jgi:hypothetical protein
MYNKKKGPAVEVLDAAAATAATLLDNRVLRQGSGWLLG